MKARVARWRRRKRITQVRRRAQAINRRRWRQMTGLVTLELTVFDEHTGESVPDLAWAERMVSEIGKLPSAGREAAP